MSPTILPMQCKPLPVAATRIRGNRTLCVAVANIPGSYPPSDRLDDERGIGRVARRARTTDRSISSPTERARARTHARICVRTRRRRRRRRRWRRAKGYVLPSAPPAMSWWPPCTDRNSLDQIQSPNVMPCHAHALPTLLRRLHASNGGGNTTTRPTARGRRRPLGALNSRVPARFAGGRVPVSSVAAPTAAVVASTAFTAGVCTNTRADPARGSSPPPRRRRPGGTALARSCASLSLRGSFGTLLPLPAS